MRWWKFFGVLLAGVVLGAVLASTSTFLLWGSMKGDEMPDVLLDIARHSRHLKTGLEPSSEPSQMDNTQQCLCGEQLAALKKRTASNKPLHTSPMPHLLEQPVGQDNTSRTAKQPSPVIISNQQYSPIDHLSQEASVRNTLVVGVMGTNHPECAETVYKTWGQDASHLLIFVGDGFNFSHASARGLPLVRQSTNAHKFAALEYLSEHYLESHQWFLLAAPDSYVRIEKLEGLLSQLNPTEKLYIGRSASGKEEELNLTSNEYYCQGGSGIVLSNGLLSALKHHLRSCQALDEVMKMPGDVGLGKCISRKLHIQCTRSVETRKLFYVDYSKEVLSAEKVQKREVFSTLVSYHPMSKPSSMYLLHRHYKLLQFEAALNKAHQIQKQVNEVCGSLNSPPKCTPSVCPCQDQGYILKCPYAGTVSSPPPPYQPTTVYDYQAWDYFDSNSVYPERHTHPTYRLKAKRNFRTELQQVLTKAVQRTSELYGRRLKFTKLLNGWVRHNPFRGNEYILDLLLVDGIKKIVSRRVSMLRPLASNYITLKDNIDSTSYINMIVPIAKVNDRFRDFMFMYESLALETREHVNLVLCVFGQEDVLFVTSVVDGYRTKYPDAIITILEGKGNFSRGKALDLGFSYLEPTQLAFICDVDMRVTHSFLQRCRRNAIRGARVYYPEFFKLYNLDYVYWQRERPPVVTLKREHGHWAYYSFGMLCIYKSDYTAVGGMDTNIEGWGDEDVHFFQKVVRKRLDVLRAPDTGLSHRWHDKICAKSLSRKQLKHCYSSQSENLADRKELAKYIFQLGVNLKSEATSKFLSNGTIENEIEEDYNY